MIDEKKVLEIVKTASDRIQQTHIGCFQGMDKPLFLISEAYPGLWLEHAYDSVFYASKKPEYLELAENVMNLFMDHQTPEGQIPFTVMRTGKVRYSQVQECVSFFSLCLEVYRMNQDRAFLRKAYEAGKGWVGWIRRYRMTTGRGLAEMFVGYDSGHDNSGRLQGMACPGNYRVDGVEQNAATRPPEDGITPIGAVDMTCNLFGNLTALSHMAAALGLEAEKEQWRREAAGVKEALMGWCYDEGDAFFYDIDRSGRKRKYRSSTIFHLFMEGVLDPGEDADMIDRIHREHIRNPEEFWTPYPFPSMAVNDPSCAGHGTANCWGYYTMGLIVERCERWMDRYGWGKEYDHVLEKWLEGWTNCFERVPLGQELDPLNGEPTSASPWYSSGMLSYINAAVRLGIAAGF